MNDIKTFLNNFLDTIGYPDNKDEFINKFLSAIYIDALDESLKTLSEEKRTELENKLQTSTTPELVQEVVKNNLDEALFAENLKKSSQKLFAEYITTIGDTLSTEQTTKLQEYFASVTPKNP